MRPSIYKFPKISMFTPSKFDVIKLAHLQTGGSLPSEFTTTGNWGTGVDRTGTCGADQVRSSFCTGAEECNNIRDLWELTVDLTHGELNSLTINVENAPQNAASPVLVLFVLDPNGESIGCERSDAGSTGITIGNGASPCGLASELMSGTYQIHIIAGNAINNTGVWGYSLHVIPEGMGSNVITAPVRITQNDCSTGFSPNFCSDTCTAV